MAKKRSSKTAPNQPEPVPNIDPTVDFAFKRLFGVEANKPLLIDLLNAVLSPEPGARIIEVELRDPFSLKDFEDDKLSVVDIKVRDQSGRRFIVEMQMLAYPELRKRFLYYWADHYCETLKESSGYSELQPTVLIAFLCDPQFPEADDYHLTFRLCDDRHGLLFTDDLELHTIELSKVAAPPARASSQLDRWAWFLTPARGQGMAQLPQEMLDDPIFQQAFHELQKMASNPEEREAYKKRLRNLREERSRIESTARQARHDEKVLALRHRIQFAEKVLRLPPTEPHALATLPLPELERKASELEERCLSGNGQRESK